jgi:hypothetical protein
MNNPSFVNIPQRGTRERTRHTGTLRIALSFSLCAGTPLSPIVDSRWLPVWEIFAAGISELTGWTE